MVSLFIKRVVGLQVYTDTFTSEMPWHLGLVSKLFGAGRV